MVCVVSYEVFKTLEGYVTIFHEFIHCQQWDICEGKLKQELEVARKAKERKDYMWELNYPFPYGSEEFCKIYSAFLGSFEENNFDSICKYRSQLREILNNEEF